MVITINISEELSERVRQGAKLLRLSPQMIVERILRLFFWKNRTDDQLEKEISRAASFNNSNQVNHAHKVYDDDVEMTLEEVVAEIKALPPNPNAVVYGEKFGDMEYVQYLLDNPPTDTITMEEWEKHWAELETELKEMRA
ncbi:MAG: hypothetical protein AAF639_28530 [Chloroflexota bacterium]